MAEAFKQEGNDHFKAKKYGLAIKAYSKAIKASDSGDVRKVCLSNRSAAYLKMGKDHKALEDALESLEIDGTWVKARYRAASAFMSLYKYDLAFIILQPLFLTASIDPSIKSLSREILDKAGQMDGLWMKEKVPETMINEVITVERQTASLQVEGLVARKLCIGIEYQKPILYVSTNRVAENGHLSEHPQLFVQFGLQWSHLTDMASVAQTIQSTIKPLLPFEPQHWFLVGNRQKVQFQPIAQQVGEGVVVLSGDVSSMKSVTFVLIPLLKRRPRVVGDTQDLPLHTK